METVRAYSDVHMVSNILFLLNCSFWGGILGALEKPELLSPRQATPMLLSLKTSEVQTEHEQIINEFTERFYTSSKLT